jgi:hypothetical protein
MAALLVATRSVRTLYYNEYTEPELRTLSLQAVP